MHALSNTEMLEIVERGGSQTYPERALLMLAFGYPDHDRDSLRRLTLGERDQWLLALRGQTFGAALHGLIDCASCASALTMDLSIDQLLAGSRTSEREFATSIADYELRFRSPNSEDMLAILHSLPYGESPSLALARRVVKVTRGGNEYSVDDLPPEALDRVSEFMEASDPGAELRLAMQCPDCGSSFSVVFDIVLYLWSEIGAAVRQLLVEVHLLASVYGWSEREILGMSSWRREMYLGMVN